MAPNTLLSRSLPTGALVHRDCLRRGALRGVFSQRRWGQVSPKYLLKLSDAQRSWDERAQEIHDGTRKNLFDELEERGFIKDLVGSRKVIREIMRLKRIGAYAGIDPTAPSLHLGHLLAFMPLFWMYLHGYGAVTLIGTSTAKIGDPTGRTTGRPILAPSDLLQNLVSINQQLKSLWQNVESLGRRFGYGSEWGARRGIVNNSAWWNKQPMLDVLRRVGSQMRLGPLLGRDSVKTRLGEGSGLSFAEFCYPIMQAWDWCQLLQQRGIQMQIGGSDQYGNILTGAQCVSAYVRTEPNPHAKIPSKEHDQPIGFTVPLLTDSSGAKFGKSADNALWLDPFKTSHYELYGYLVRRSDEEVGRLLKLFTFHPQSEIDRVMEEHKQDPSKRVAQHLLAHEVLWLVYGYKRATETQEQHRNVYGRPDAPVPTTENAGQDLAQYQLPKNGIATSNERPRADMRLPRILLEGSLPRLVWACGLATSSSDADRTIKAGGIYLGGSPGQYGPDQTGMNPNQLSFTAARIWNYEDNKRYIIDDKYLILRKGKHNMRIIEFISDEEFNKLGLTYFGQPKVGAYRQAVATLQRLKKEAKLAKEGGNDKAKVDVDKLPVLESVLRTARFRSQVGQLKEDGLAKDDGW